ncbi:MAG: DUF1036 domain-containing protein [Actinomycetota bacterium]
MNIDRKKIVGLATISILGGLLPLLNSTNGAFAGCSALDFTCNPHIRDLRNRIDPPMPQRRSEIYDRFNLTNQSNETVYFAYGEYRPGSTSSGDGSGSSLAVITPPSWVSEGWWSVNPGESKVVYETRSKGKSIYIRITSNSGVKVPDQSEHIAAFCISNQGYSSKEIERASSFSLTINGQSNRGSSCEQIGGRLESFWRVKANINFIVR